MQENAVSLLRSEGELYQSELWKQLDVGSRSGSRIAQALAEKGLIEREEAIRKGRKTYLLTFLEGETEDSSESVMGMETDVRDLDSVDVPFDEVDVELSVTQRRAAALIYDSGELTQSELWKTLGVSSRTGTRVARALVDAGLIDREESSEYERKTYVLTPISVDGESDEGRDTGERSGSAPVEDAEEPGELLLTASEEQVFEYVTKTNGVPQNSLRSHVDEDSEVTVDEIVQSLVAKDLIRQTEESYYGRRTFWVEPVSAGSQKRRV